MKPCASALIRAPFLRSSRTVSTGNSPLMDGLMMYAFANNVLESVRIPEVKARINKLIANKLGVHIGFDL